MTKTALLIKLKFFLPSKEKELHEAVEEHLQDFSSQVIYLTEHIEDEFGFVVKPEATEKWMHENDIEEVDENVENIYLNAISISVTGMPWPTEDCSEEFKKIFFNVLNEKKDATETKWIPFEEVEQYIS